MWRYRIKKFIWWVSPQVYYWFIAWLAWDNVLNLWWNGAVVGLLIWFCWPEEAPREPRIVWWVESRRIWPTTSMWNGEGWSLSRKKAEAYLRSRRYRADLQWRIVKQEVE